MRTASKMTRVAAACGAGALGLALIAMGSGVGAAFTDTATANARIAIGTFGCTLSSTDGNVIISNNGHTADVTLPTIQGSAPGTEKAPLTVTNTGSIPLAVNWTVTQVGTTSVTALPVASGLAINSGNHRTYDIGFSWNELHNSDLGQGGTVTYSASCVEVPSTQIVRSAALNYAGTGWGGWSCPAGTQIVSATAENSSGVVQMAEIDLWRSGASTSTGVNYPATPFGYTYATGEEGAIAQNDGAAAPITLVLTCTA